MTLSSELDGKIYLQQEGETLGEETTKLRKMRDILKSKFFHSFIHSYLFSFLTVALLYSIN